MIDVRAAFGAVGNGVADDTVALRAAFASAHEALYFPPGVYHVPAASVAGACLSRSNRSLVIAGAGPEVTQILWDPPTDEPSAQFIKFYTNYASNDRYDRFEVRDISLKAGKNLDAAIHATKDVPTGQVSRVRQQARIHNVAVTGVGTHAQGTFKSFSKGAYLDGMDHLKVHSFSAEADVRQGSVGLYITATPGRKTTDAHIHQVTLVNFESGALFMGEEEGLILSDSIVIGCKTGVYTGMSTDGAPGLILRGNHFSCYEQCVSLANLAQAIISDNLFYMIGNHPSRVGINVGGFSSGIDKDTIITGNVIMNTDPSRGLFGIYVPGSPANESVIISNNQIVGWEHGVRLDPASNGVFVSNSNRYRACTANVTNLATNPPGANVVQ